MSELIISDDVVVGLDNVGFTTKRVEHGTYDGPDEAFKGKSAILQVSETELWCVAQFDDVGTGKGYDWWLFPYGHFEPDI